jgi:hypothetical protein
MKEKMKANKKPSIIFRKRQEDLEVQSNGYSGPLVHSTCTFDLSKREIFTQAGKDNMILDTGR